MEIAFSDKICILRGIFGCGGEKTYCSDQEALCIVKYFWLTNKLMIHTTQSPGSPAQPRIVNFQLFQ